MGHGADVAWDATGGKVVQAIATHTFGPCLNGSVGLGYYGEASGCLLLSGGKPGASVTITGGGGSPNASVGVGLQVSNARSLNGVRGPFVAAGGSAGVGVAGGVQGPIGTGPCNSTIVQGEGSLGLGIPFAPTPIPIPAEFHAGVSYTWAWGL